MRQRPGSSLVQVMACRLFGVKPLPEPMLAYCQLDSLGLISMKFEWELCHFHSRKCIWNCRLPKWRPFYPEGDELMSYSSYETTRTWRVMETYCYNWQSACSYCYQLNSLIRFRSYQQSQASLFTSGNRDIVLNLILYMVGLYAKTEQNMKLFDIWRT